VKKNISYFIFVFALLLSACSTDLDVVGDYKETLIVYGLLDQAQDTQYIKINKAFLGEGDAYTYAQIKDSTQFINALDVRIKRLSDNTEFTLMPAPPNLIKKDPGVFYSETQTNAIYYFLSPTGTLNSNSEYKLTVRNSETGTEVSSKTSLVSDITGFTSPVATATFSFVVSGNTNPNYPFVVKWVSAKNAKIYQAIIRLNYTDSTTTGNKANFVDYKLPEIKTNGLNGGEEMLVSTSGRLFYQYVASVLSDYSGLQARIVNNVQLLLVSGSDDLNTFIEVNRPSTGIIQEKQEYTNITNGLGLFSSRLNRKPLSKQLSPTSWDSLACGQFTRQLKFLNASGQHPCL
jgi:hypothetical protein